MQAKIVFNRDGLYVSEELIDFEVIIVWPDYLYSKDILYKIPTKGLDIFQTKDISQSVPVKEFVFLFDRE